ncbi:sensor histidine kinase [Streptomyces cinereoruber]|uniref:sensor histidine kinase n=1 Tax=Streptomyces cinereoruber TaxID=67260 RepID=UPI003BF4E8DA
MNGWAGTLRHGGTGGRGAASSPVGSVGEIKGVGEIEGAEGGEHAEDFGGLAGADGDAVGRAAGGSAPGPAPGVVSVVLIGVMLGFSFEPVVLQPHPAAVPVLLLQLVVCLPSTRRLRGAWALAAQILLAPWSGLPGFVGASVLLVVRHRVRWALFAVVVLAGGLLAAGGSAHHVLNDMGNALAHGLVLYALTRLTDLYAELGASRQALARARIAAERERAGRTLDAALGTALTEVIRLAGQGTRAARQLVTVAREAAERVRGVPPAQSAQAPAGGADAPGAPLPRLVWPIVLATHAEYLVVGVAFLLGDGVRGAGLAAYTAALAAVVGLQAYHSLPRPPGVRPRGATWTLSAQLAVALCVLAAPDGPYPQLIAFATASVLIVLPGRVAWPAAGALVALASLVVLARTDGPGARGTVLLLLDIVVIALVFYGLALLTGLVHQVREAREALAALAVARERRRIARDVHDLLGYGLSAIALKGELAARDPDRSRARAHLADAAALAGRTLADLRAIPEDGTELALAAEVESARQVFAAAGIRMELREEGGLADAAREGFFATVLREAVTNVLRHAAGVRRCVVEIGPGLLRVADDGRAASVPRREGGPAAGASGGNGLRNLRERAEALGGRLETGETPDGYVLTVRLGPAAVPVDAAVPADAAVSFDASGG